jgi:hypothetical protein
MDEDYTEQTDYERITNAIHNKTPHQLQNESFIHELNSLIQFSNEPILKQIENTITTFFNMVMQNDSEENENFINLISQLFMKNKCIHLLNIFISYYHFIKRIKKEIYESYIENDIHFINNIDFKVKPIDITLNDFKINITSTSEKKFNFLARFIEKNIMYNNDNNINNNLEYDLIYGIYPIGYILHIILKNNYFIPKERTNKHLITKLNSTTNKFQANLVKCETDIKNRFILTKRNTSVFRETYERFVKIIQSKNNVMSSISQIFPFGSVTQLTQNNVSDLEITLITKNYQNDNKETIQEILELIKTELQKDTEIYKEIKYRETKRTQLLILDDKISDVKIECNLNNYFGLLNSNLIRNYLTFDSRAIILVNTIKDWSKQKKINGNNLGYLSSYCYTLMTIYFLQRISNPVLPIWTSKRNLFELNVNQKQYFIEKMLVDIEMNKKFTSTNNDVVVVLFMKFLQFYLNIFNESCYCIDVASKNLVYRYEEVKYLNKGDNNKNSVYCFIDMFDYTYNPGAYFKENTYEHDRFKKVMIKTLEQVLQGDNNVIGDDTHNDDNNN